MFYNNYKKINLSIFNRRLFFSVFFIIFFIFIIIIRLFYMQILNFNDYYNRSYKNCTKLKIINPKRGTIFDRNGVILAKDITFYQLKIYKNKDYFNKINKLKKVINLSIDDINNLILLNKNNSNKNYIILNKLFKDYEIINLLSNKFYFPEIKIKKVYIRYYPFNKIVSHSVGYISRIDKNDIYKLIKNNNLSEYFGINYIGKVGIEKSYEYYLKGKIGFKEIEINNLGKKIGLKKIIYPKDGNDIHLTIDIKLNKYINNLTKNSKAAVIVTDINNGEILSLISNPNYDPNILYKGNIKKEVYNSIFFNKSYPMLNRVTQGIYPPASTVKPFIALYALQNRFIDKNYFIFDSGLWKIPILNKTYRGWKKTSRGWINIFKALEESSDIFFYNLSYQLGIENIFNYMLNFGYGNKTGIDILEEYSGILPNDIWKKNKFKDDWKKGDTISVGIGQGYWSSTPIQMSKSLMILANNGYIKIPHLLKSMYNSELNKYKYFIYDKNLKIKDKIDNKNWNFVKDGMYRVTNNENGTAKMYFKNSKYKVAAKTGTAQLFRIRDKDLIFDRKRNEISVRPVPKYLRDHKLMIAYAPFDNPKFAVVIVLENGGLEKLSIGHITRKIFDYLILKNK